jgi:hypothetical protein
MRQAQFRKYYIEITKPCFPSVGFDYSFHNPRTYSRDNLSPDLISLFSVTALSRKDAIARLMARTSDVLEVI